MSIYKYLRGKQFFGQPPVVPTNSGPQMWAGRTTLSSGSATVTVSTNLVRSNSLILLGVHAGVSSGTQRIDVRTIVHGSYFTLGWSDGASKVNDAVIMWAMIRAN